MRVKRNRARWKPAFTPFKLTLHLAAITPMIVYQIQLDTTIEGKLI